MQPVTQPQPSPALPSILLYRLQPPPTAIPSSGRRPPPRQSRYKLQLCKILFFHLPHPMDTSTPGYQPPKIEDEPIVVEATEPDLNTDFEENVPQQEGIIHEVYKRLRKEYL